MSFAGWMVDQVGRGRASSEEPAPSGVRAVVAGDELDELGWDDRIPFDVADPSPGEFDAPLPYALTELGSSELAIAVVPRGAR